MASRNAERGIPERPEIILERRLREKEGIQTWLDKWNLIPGASWKPAVEDASKDAKVARSLLALRG